MKHLLNDLSNEEKNRIREQHEGGITIDTSKFRKLLENKLGDVKPLIMEETPGTEVVVTGPEVIPQSLVDNEPPKGSYISGGRQGWFSLEDNTNNVTYKFPVGTKGTFNYGVNLAGSIEAMTNELLLDTSEYIVKFNRGTTPASKIVANTKDKYIGFLSDDDRVRFACFKNISNEFVCEEYGFYELPKQK